MVKLWAGGTLGSATPNSCTNLLAQLSQIPWRGVFPSKMGSSRGLDSLVTLCSRLPTPQNLQAFHPTFCICLTLWLQAQGPRIV